MNYMSGWASQRYTSFEKEGGNADYLYGYATVYLPESNVRATCLHRHDCTTGVDAAYECGIQQEAILRKYFG